MTLVFLGSLSPPRSGSLERWDYHWLRGGWCFGTSTPGVFHIGFYNDLQIILSFSWRFEDAKLKNSVLEIWNLPRVCIIFPIFSQEPCPMPFAGEVKSRPNFPKKFINSTKTNQNLWNFGVQVYAHPGRLDRGDQSRGGWLLAWCAFFWHGKLRPVVSFETEFGWTCFFLFHFLVAGVSELHASEIQWVLQLGKMSACLWSDYQWHTNDKSQVATSKLPDP